MMRCAVLLRDISRTARYHEVCTTDEDRYDGGGSGEDWDQCRMFPEGVY